MGVYKECDRCNIREPLRDKESSTQVMTYQLNNLTIKETMFTMDLCINHLSELNNLISKFLLNHQFPKSPGE